MLRLFHDSFVKGPALMALRSKAFAKALSCHLPLPRFESHRACEKVASDLGLDGGFRWILLFPPPS